ncbi:MAG: DUF2945 domain-containing protein [Phormidesmis sp.]
MVSKQRFHKGDRVQWSSGSGTATGKIEKRITEDQQVEGKTVSASEDDPRYLVKNDSTGNVTGHRPDTLSKADAEASSDSDSFEQGDRVQWNTRQGKTTGTVKEKLTDTTEIKGHTAKASEEDPQYRVESERTGSEAAHKPDALEPAE